MIRLRKVLLSNYLYLTVIILVLIISLIRINIEKTSIYNKSINEIIGVISKYNVDGNKLSLTLNSKEKLIGTYYFKNKKEKNHFINDINLGDKVKVIGKLNHLKKSTTKNLYDYKFHMNNKSIFYSISISKINLVSKNKNLYYFIKNLIIKRLNNNPYLYTFILGDKSSLNKDITKSYQNNGISHLFAISGMHISLLSGLILKLLQNLKVKEERRYLITSIFLISYLFLTGLSVSILRGVLFFLLFSLNKIYYFHIKSVNIFIATLALSLIINPFYLYEAAFWYSFLISLSLIVLSSFITNFKNYFLKLSCVSLISFIVSIPISLYNFYQINLLSIIYNLFYVPFISIVVFPLALISFLIPPIESIFNITIYILEKTSLILDNIKILTFIFKKLPLIIYIFYFIFIILIFIAFKYKNKLLIIPFILLIIIHYNISFFDNSTYLHIIDVSQGDSTLITVKGQVVLIDTGGIASYSNNKWEKKKNDYSLVSSITIPLLKSLGLKKINYLILTHGDFDHMGEAFSLVNNFKVETVIFNNGDYNNLELELIKNLEEKRIPYYQNIEQLNLGDNTLYFLNNKVYSNENDNSNVIYTELNGTKLLLMGDASIEVEKDILEKYSLFNIDILKVGHHGSNTSSSKYFINSINPKYSFISVGKNNRYSHPKESVLDTLKKSKIYRTDIDGSIEVKITKNNYEIKTYSP